MQKIDLVKDSIIGCLMAGAAGDALGYPVEFMSRKEILSRYGEKGITEFELTPEEITLVSDDTQMTLFTANGLLWGETQNVLNGGDTPVEDYVRGAYIDWYFTQTGESSPSFPPSTWLRHLPDLAHRRAPDTTCMGACENLLRGVGPLNNSKGCGGIMRVAPMGLYAAAFKARNGRPLYDSLRLAEAGAKIAKFTHLHPLGYLPAALMTLLVAHLVPLTPEEAKATIVNFVNKDLDTMMQIEGNKNMEDKAFLKKLTLKAIDLAKYATSEAEAIRQLGEGWTAEEAWAISLYCAIRHIDSMEDAIIAAVNHDGDSDSTGSITGNIMGAIYGYKAITDECLFCPEKLFYIGRRYKGEEKVVHESQLKMQKLYFELTMELHEIILALAEDLYSGCIITADGPIDTREKKLWKARYCTKVEIPDLSQPDLVEYLLKRFDYDEDICYSLKTYSDKVSVARDERCQYCGGTPVNLYYRNDPVAWVMLAGREGDLTVCPECGQWNHYHWFGMS